MNCAVLAFVVSAISLPLCAETSKSDTRVRATEPTVITVEGTPPARAKTANVNQKVRTGAATVAKGIAAATGWLLNTEDDVPGHQDRTRSPSDGKRKNNRSEPQGSSRRP